MTIRGFVIRGFVLKRLADGVEPWDIYREAQERFQHKCCGWDYVLRLTREAGRSAVASSVPEKTKD